MSAEKNCHILVDIDGRHCLISDEEIDEKFQKIIHNLFGIEYNGIRELIVQMRQLSPNGKPDFSPEGIKKFFLERVTK